MVVRVDQKTVATEEGALAIGTRLAVKWTHGWENGTVTKVLVDRRSSVHTYTVMYDDGETHNEDLRKEVARYLEPPRKANELPKRETRHSIEPSEEAPAAAPAEEEEEGETEGEEEEDDEANEEGEGSSPESSATAPPPVSRLRKRKGDDPSGKDANERPDEEAAPAAPPRPPAKGKETWVACDACEKWRRISVSARQLPSTWQCSDNPDKRFSSCKTPQARRGPLLASSARVQPSHGKRITGVQGRHGAACVRACVRAGALEV